VFGRGKREIREPDLSQPTQPLNGRRVEERDLTIVEFDEMVNGIEDPLHCGVSCVSRRRALPRVRRFACLHEEETRSIRDSEQVKFQSWVA
jgi:hypothetical protein